MRTHGVSQASSLIEWGAYLHTGNEVPGLDQGRSLVVLTTDLSFTLLQNMVS